MTYTGVDTTLGDHLAVEVGELVDDGEILQEDGSSMGSNSQAVVVIADRGSVRRGESVIHLERVEKTGDLARRRVPLAKLGGGIFCPNCSKFYAQTEALGEVYEAQVCLKHPLISRHT